MRMAIIATIAIISVFLFHAACALDYGEGLYGVGVYQPESPCSHGDLNCDGSVDILDLSFIASHFGQTNSHPQWNATADVVPDNEIDIYDVVFVANRFG